MASKIRDIDHLVLAVRDLDIARDLYKRLGFTLTPAARQPDGTVSSLVQLSGSHLELLAVDQAASVADARAGHFSNAAFHRDFLAVREGLSMLALGSDDAAADRESFLAAKLPVYEPVVVERILDERDNVATRVSFSLTYTSDARVHGNAAFLTCQNLEPENSGQAASAKHANGAEHIDAAVFVTRDPADFHEFLTYFTGQPDMLSTSLRVSFNLGRSRLDVLSPVAFKAFFGEETEADPRRFQACRIGVRDLGIVRELLGKNGVPVSEIADAVVVPSSFALGAVVAFVAA